MFKSKRAVFLFSIPFAGVLIAWFIGMFFRDGWFLFEPYWPLSLTMVLGSFVAGATAEGGGAIAFPVFTKVFLIEPSDARTFSFMIQSVGMTMAAVYIYVNRIPVLWKVIGYGLIGGVLGFLIGDNYINLSGAYPKVIFSIVAGVFGAFLVINRWFLNATPKNHLTGNTLSNAFIITITGFFGGVVSSIIGVGIDMVVFIVLTLYFAVNEKMSTPTTVVLMGLLSIIGFGYHAIMLNDIKPKVYDFWMACIPVVIIGAPLGAYAASKIKRDWLIYFLLGLISIELISTILLIPFSPMMLKVVLLALCASCVIFVLLLRYRK